MNDAPPGFDPSHDPTTWVFGYGSLIWRQDFPFLDARRAWISGFGRRFWQGSHDHRGSAAAPGRVVTLIESPGERCFGKAFLVTHDVFDHLDHREKNGYTRYELTIHFDAADVGGVTYVAPHNNQAFLGAAALHDMVEQILRSHGDSGANTEYVLELATALRELEIHDAHVFDIEAALLRSMGAANS